jgi:hypothetical protein
MYNTVSMVTVTITRKIPFINIIHHYAVHNIITIDIIIITILRYN